MPSKYSIRYGSAYCNASGEAPNKTRMGRVNSRPMTINTPAQHNNSVQARFKISLARALSPLPRAMANNGAPPLPNKLLNAVIMTIMGKQSPTAPSAAVPISGMRAI